MYLVRPQCLAIGRGYIECEPHQASRFALLKQTRYPARRGRKAYTITEVVNTFHGAKALERAKEAKASLEGRDDKPRSTLFRSLTRSEYEKAMGR